MVFFTGSIMFPRPVNLSRSPAPQVDQTDVDTDVPASSALYAPPYEFEAPEPGSDSDASSLSFLDVDSISVEAEEVDAPSAESIPVDADEADDAPSAEPGPLSGPNSDSSSNSGFDSIPELSDTSTDADIFLSSSFSDSLTDVDSLPDLEAFSAMNLGDSSAPAPRPSTPAEAFSEPGSTPEPRVLIQPRALPELSGEIQEDSPAADQFGGGPRTTSPVYGSGFLEVHRAPRGPDLAFDPTLPQRRWSPALSPIRDFLARPVPSTESNNDAPVPSGPPPYWSLCADEQGANGASALPGPDCPTPVLPPYRAETTPPPPYTPEVRPPPYSLGLPDPEFPRLGPNPGPGSEFPSYLIEAVNNLNAALRYSAGISQTRPDQSSRLLSLAVVQPSLSVPHFRALRREVLSAPHWARATGADLYLGHSETLHALFGLDAFELALGTGLNPRHADRPTRRLSVRALLVGDDYGVRLEIVLDYYDARLQMVLNSIVGPDLSAPMEFDDARLDLYLDSDRMDAD